MKSKACSFLVAFWICCAAHGQQSAAQQAEIFSRYYSMKDGLSNDAALCLLQDSQGFIWIGTYAGLNKFDGYHFTTYVENPLDSNSLANNAVICLWEDKQQRLWIGTGAGLQLFDLRAERFQPPGTDSLDPAKGFNIITNKIRPNKIRGRKDGKVWYVPGREFT